MRKWTYLVAALLLGGTTATFTGCIENEEPAGITELRGAKAELLRAKAVVQAAEAAIKNAQAACLEADALYKQEVAAQAKIRTEILAAQSEKDKAYWKQEAEKSAEAFKAEMFRLQQQTTLAEADYKKALVDVEVALVAYKESAYAAQLYKVLNTESFSYQTYVWNGTTYVPGSTVTVMGLYGLANQLTTEQNNLATAMRSKAEAEFANNPEVVIKSVENEVVYQTGIVSGLEKNLAELQIIANTPMADWVAKYEGVQTKQKGLQAQIDALDVEKTEKMVAPKQKKEELTNKYGLKTELKFTVTAALQDEFYWGVREAMNYSTSTEYAKALNKIAVYDADKQEYSFPNGFSLMMNPDVKHTLFNGGYVPSENWTSLLDLIKGNVMEGNALAEAQQYLKKLATNKEDAKKAYDAVITNWTTVKDEFTAAADAYKYNYRSTSATNRYDARTLILKKIAEYEEIEEPTAAQTTAITNAIITFLDQRAKLDGFTVMVTIGTDEPEKAQTAIKKAGGLEAYLAMSDYAQVGSDYLDGTGGLYGKYVKASAPIWENAYFNWSTPSSVIPLVAITYEEWKESMNNNETGWIVRDVYRNAYNGYPYTIPTNPNNGQLYRITTVVGDGLANDMFYSEYLYEQKYTQITHATEWKQLYTDIVAADKANQKVISDYSLAINDLDLQIAAITDEYVAKTADLTQQITGLDEVLRVMKEYTSSAATGGYTGMSFDDALASIKSQMNNIDGQNGSLTAAKATLNELTKKLAALKSGDYVTAQASLIKYYEAQITVIKAQIDSLNVLFKAATAKKDQLMAGLTK